MRLDYLCRKLNLKRQKSLVFLLLQTRGDLDSETNHNIPVQPLFNITDWKESHDSSLLGIILY